MKKAKEMSVRGMESHQNLAVFHFIVLFTVFHNPFLCVIDWMSKERECLKENTMVNIALEKIKKRLPFF